MGEEKAKHLFLVVKNKVSLGNDDYYRIYERIYIYIYCEHASHSMK